MPHTEAKPKSGIPVPTEIPLRTVRDAYLIFASL
jgi:hypothetical protein